MIQKENKKIRKISKVTDYAALIACQSLIYMYVCFVFLCCFDERFRYKEVDKCDGDPLSCLVSLSAVSRTLTYEL